MPPPATGFSSFTASATITQSKCTGIGGGAVVVEEAFAAYASHLSLSVQFLTLAKADIDKPKLVTSDLANDLSVSHDTSLACFSRPFKPSKSLSSYPIQN